MTKAEAMREKIGHWRWFLADWLSYCACRLRGHRWYAGWCYDLHGNRAAVLRQGIWEDIVTLGWSSEGTCPKDEVLAIEPKLIELAQLAGENWGHQPRRDE